MFHGVLPSTEECTGIGPRIPFQEGTFNTCGKSSPLAIPKKVAVEFSTMRGGVVRRFPVISPGEIRRARLVLTARASRRKKCRPPFRGEPSERTLIGQRNQLPIPAQLCWLARGLAAYFVSPRSLVDIEVMALLDSRRRRALGGELAVKRSGDRVSGSMTAGVPLDGLPGATGVP